MKLQPKNQNAESMGVDCPLPIAYCLLNGGNSSGISKLEMGNRKLAIRQTSHSAFTLIEMITVLTIIIIVLAIAIPVWNALLGGTNLASAQNQISAFLSNARADAIFNRQTIGVCFYIDPKTTQTAVAEVQVQTLWQAHPYGGTTATYTSLFIPGYYNPTWNPATYQNGPINTIELVNNPDPNNPGNFNFYRDVTLLPKGVGVAFNANTYTYNYNNQWNYQASAQTPNSNVPPLDRYVRLGVIMFNPDGTLASIPFGIPYQETFVNGGTQIDNLLCTKVGMTGTYTYDIASNVNAAPPSTVTTIPLMSSVGFVVFDHDVYATQHCSMQVMNVGSSPASQVTLGSGDPFSDMDMTYPRPPSPAPTANLKLRPLPPA